jgi:PAS domain S-box-containing protein
MDAKDPSRAATTCLWGDTPLTVDFLASIIDAVAHPIFVKDRQFRFVILNRAFCEMVGYGREDMLGKTDYDFFARAEADFFRQKDVEMFSTGSQVTIDEEPITDASGTQHVLATTKVPLRNAADEVTYLVGIIHDITRLKAAEAVLRVSNEELERRVRDRTAALHEAQAELVRKERLAVLGQLTGGIAHQIRNPLGAITNAVAVLKRSVRSGDASDAGQALAAIEEEAWQANRIITDLLEYARVRPAVARLTSVRSIVEQALGARTIPPTVRVSAHVDGVPAVAVDPDQVRDALENLISNAVEAMESSGSLAVTARSDGAEVVIGIADSGPGIAPAIMSHLFEPLVSTKPLGFGLGLVTARALIENQGGSIGCESPASGGARFEVRLPVG